MWTPEAPGLLGHFRTHFATEPLVFDKWLTLNAMPTHDETPARLRAILADPDFPRNNPNRLRALVGAFAMNNLVQFAREDGEGFRFVAEFVADVDRRNPQVAARVLTAFRIWRDFEPRRREAAEAALRGLAATEGLSPNVADILTRTLSG
jgi:aminopeptidase N